MSIPHIPILRFGKVYASLDRLDVCDYQSGKPLLSMSQSNVGILRKDFRNLETAFAALQEIPSSKMVEICAKAGELFLNGTLPLGDGGQMQSTQDYIDGLSRTSGLPHVMIRTNIKKIHHVFTDLPTILKGLTRNLDLRILDQGIGTQDGIPISYFPTTQGLGVIAPSNSPAVHSLWLPAIALKIPLVIKPGSAEPWTPWRMIQALIAAGCPSQAFGFYPCGHDGAEAILQNCGRALLFGDESTTARYANNPSIQLHGPGRSKILIGEDCIERWRDYIDVIVESIVANGGRSCVNASAVIVPRYSREIAQALAEKLGPIAPLPVSDPNARLSGFANPKMGEFIDNTIETGLKEGGAEDVTAAYRKGARKQELDGGVYLCPTIVHCDSFKHSLANKEFLCPYASVVEIPQAQMLNTIGHSLVVTAITEDKTFRRKLLNSPLIGRLNFGAVPTYAVRWDQPHEGNLFEFLYQRRAVQSADML